MTAADNQTLERAVPRHHLGFPEFYTAAFPLVVGRVFLIVGHKYLAEDLAQDAMVEMMRQWHDRCDLPLEHNIGWAVGIAANLARRHQRRAVTGMRALSRWAGLHRPPLVHLEIEVLARDEAYRRIAGLPKQQRAVAVLWAFGGMTAEAIAQTLGVTSSTVRTHLQRIRKQLVAQAGHAAAVDDQPPATRGVVSHDH
jgi:RNA polymerase sigma factor (sigma-70 family)